MSLKIRMEATGDFRKTKKYLENFQRLTPEKLRMCGEWGVNALASATPVDTCKTASGWFYKINKTQYSISIEWWNTNVNDGVPIALVIQYGHMLPNGTYIQGRDYINPAMRPVFDQIERYVWKEVTGK